MLTIHMILLVWDHILLKCLHVPSQESERSCFRVLGVSILPLSTILIFDFGIVPTVWYFLVFHFIYALKNKLFFKMRVQEDLHV